MNVRMIIECDVCERDEKWTWYWDDERMTRRCYGGMMRYNERMLHEEDVIGRWEEDVNEGWEEGENLISRWGKGDRLREKKVSEKSAVFKYEHCEENDWCPEIGIGHREDSTKHGIHDILVFSFSVKFSDTVLGIFSCVTEDSVHLFVFWLCSPLSISPINAQNTHNTEIESFV